MHPLTGEFSELLVNKHPDPGTRRRDSNLNSMNSNDATCKRQKLSDRLSCLCSLFHFLLALTSYHHRWRLLTCNNKKLLSAILNMNKGSPFMFVRSCTRQMSFYPSCCCYNTLWLTVFKVILWIELAKLLESYFFLRPHRLNVCSCHFALRRCWVLGYFNFSTESVGNSPLEEEEVRKVRGHMT